MVRRSLRHLGTALLLLVVFACQVTWALASVTGGLTGTVLDAETSAPIAGVQVIAASPSQSATTTTDAGGHFTFLTLAPDTYTVSVAKSGYQNSSVPGQTVFADTVQIVSIRMLKALRTIAHVTAASAGALVKSGTTADVYSINASSQAAAATLGGGGLINQAYSAISTVPGAYVIPNQTGYYATVNIRGGDYDQVGYEFDGVPVNRSFDNYASSSASSLGNAEVQVYTGANPANSEGQGLAGFINQVIKTGTYPGYATGSLGIGTPSFYHRAAIEIGGSTPDRNFSYYVGVAGLNQSFNYINSNNGSEYDGWLGPVMGIVGGPYGQPFAPGWSLFYGGTGNSYYPLGPVSWPNNDASLGLGSIYGRNTVVNFHIGIPHHNDAGRDDIQLLWDDEALKNMFNYSANAFASPFCSSGAAAQSGANCMYLVNGEMASLFTGGSFPYGTPLPVTYLNTYTWGCAPTVGGRFSASQLNALQGCVKPYGFPNGTNVGSPTNPSVIPAAANDQSYNDTAITKIQYTKNFGSTAYLRLYGFTFYSDWFLNGPYNTTFCNFFCPLAPDYELNTHTRGLSLEFQDQLNEQNLLQVNGSFTTSRIVRDNNGFYNLGGEGSFANVVNAANPYSGYCFNPAASGKSVVSCHANTVPLSPGYGNGSGLPGLGNTCAIPGKPQFGSACTYMVSENGLNGTYSGTIPNFYGASIQDQYRPTDKWLLNIGVRLDSFGFVGQNTLVPPLGGSAQARAFWFNAYNLDNCINNQTGKPFPNPAPATACPSGSHAANVQNVPANFTYNIYQPRIAGTYTSNPDDVFRFSYGRYTEAPNTAFEQYNTRQEDLADYIGSHFLAFGRNSPGYPIQPPTSINYDISWEHRVKNTDWSFKLTPFLRQTQDQIQQFFLNPQNGFVSGLNVGSQRSEGVEFQLQKGDFSRDGLSGLMSFAYTNSYVHYGPIAAGASGTTVLAPINASIAQYNGYTKYCASHPSSNPNAMCGTLPTNGLTAAPCYTPTGSPVGAGPGGGCPHNDIANPYWNSAPQSLINTGQNFPTYDTFPGSLGLAAQGFGSPYVGTLVLNYKHQRFAITPSLQFQGGGKYGIPITEGGIDPASGCGKPLFGDRYNASTCPGVVDIPNPFTGAFDPIGAFTEPNELTANLQLSYDVSPRIQLVGQLTNIVNYCWGGSQTPWTFADGNICSYGNVQGTVFPVAPYGTPGAIVNPPGYPGSQIQPFRKFPYEPQLGPAIISALNGSYKTPIQFYLTANFKI
ncbi:MAG TPA: TonB-dependent receptor [Candidatus Nitrosotalea sp.]|nr:TonB-dependent receptor [Candidatus Nitrosotalea sp.]